MPRISKAAVPVEQAVTAPLGVDLGPGGRGLQQLGAAVSRVGAQLRREEKLKVLMEKKWRDELDAEGRMRADNMRDISDIRMKTFMENTPQSEQWPRAFEMELQAYEKRVTKLNLSEKEREREEARGEIWSDKQKLIINSAALQQKLTDNIAAASAQYARSIEDGDEIEIAESKEEITARLRQRFDEFEVQELLRKIEADAQADVVKTQNEQWSNDIAVAPTASRELLDTELKNRKKGEGEIPEEDLPSSDIQSLIRLANSRETQIEADTNAAKEAEQKAIENDLHDGINDPKRTTSVTDIRASNLDVEAKRRLLRDIDESNRRDIEKDWPLVDNDLSIQRLDSLMSSLETGIIDTSQMYQQINNAATDGFITRETRGRLRKLAKDGGRDAIDIATKAGVDQIGNALIGRFTDREARFKVRELAGTMTSAEQREASSNAYLLQVNKHQLSLIEGEINRTMRLTGKDVISGVEATAITATVWEKFRKKKLGEKINDFKEFSGERIPKPEGFSDSVWSRASNQQKADIVEASSRGMTNAEIAEVINK